MFGSLKDIELFEAYRNDVQMLGTVLLDGHPKGDFEAIFDLMAALQWSGESRQLILDTAAKARAMMEADKLLEASRA